MWSAPAESRDQRDGDGTLDAAYNIPPDRVPSRGETGAAGKLTLERQALVVAIAKAVSRFGCHRTPKSICQMASLFLG